MAQTALELIDRLIASWDASGLWRKHYLDVLVPNIVNGTAILPPSERLIVNQLRARTSAEEWAGLREIVASRAEGGLRELESDRRRIARDRERDREQAKRDSDLAAARRALNSRLLAALRADFLSADLTLATDGDRSLIDAAEYHQLKARFVEDWARNTLEQTLDAEQAAAVAASGGDVLKVSAR